MARKMQRRFRVSTEGLIPFKPGQSGNPAGKKKGTKNTATILRKIWQTKMEGKDPKTGRMRMMTVAEMSCYALAQKASKGDTRSIEIIMDRLDGKVPQAIEQSGPGGAPLSPPIIQVELVDGGEEGEC